MTEWELPDVRIYAKGQGGVADTWDPRGNQPYTAYGFVISSDHTDQDPVSTGRTTTPDRAQYYSGYWAGVQAALYGFGPPAASPVHSYGFVIVDQLIPSNAPALHPAIAASYVVIAIG